MIASALRPPRGPRTLLTALLVGVVLSGCAWSAEVEPPTPAVSEPEPTELPPPRVTDEPEVAEVAAPGDAALLDEAEHWMSEGRFRRAEILFRRHLGPEGEAEGEAMASRIPHADRALWGMAMLRLLSESPLYDREEALQILDRLVEEHPETAVGMQARWVRGLLSELAQVRAQAEQQDELLRQLTETVEQLKRIDLNRRPTGGVVVGGDTIPPAAGPIRRR